jgi:hypothetical protein
MPKIMAREAFFAPETAVRLNEFRFGTDVTHGCHHPS